MGLYVEKNVSIKNNISAMSSLGFFSSEVVFNYIIIILIHQKAAAFLSLLVWIFIQAEPIQN